MLSDPSSILSTLLFSLALLTCFPCATFAAETKPNPEIAQLQASQKAAKQWLELVDNGEYGASWDAASPILKLTVSKDSWQRILTQTRKPLGGVNSREVLDQRIAKNPHGMPAGLYHVLFYKTSFSRQSVVYELLTLYLSDGNWNVVTYQIDRGETAKNSGKKS